MFLTTARSGSESIFNLSLVVVQLLHISCCSGRYTESILWIGLMKNNAACTAPNSLYALAKSIKRISNLTI